MVLFSTQQAAAYFGISHRTLESWRISGNGPRFIKLGRLVKYNQSDLDEYISNQTRFNTSSNKKNKEVREEQANPENYLADNRCSTKNSRKKSQTGGQK